MLKTSPSRPAGAASVLGLTPQDLAKLPDYLAETAAAAGASIVEVVERGSLFAGNAMVFATNYHNIRVPRYQVTAGKIERAAGMIDAPVREYANTNFRNRAGHTALVRLGLKDALLGLPDSLTGHFDVESDKTTLTIRKDGATLLSVAPREVAASFNGKGTPRMMAKTIELLQIWILLNREVLRRSSVRRTVLKDAKTKERESHDYAVDDLQKMVDDYLGVDCNGFTGRYLNAKFPTLSVTSQTTEEEYARKTGHLRKTLADIRADDIAVFNKNGSYHHVAMVSAVLHYWPGDVLLMLSEARSAHMPKGGPQSNVWRVRQQEIKDGKGKGTPVEGKFDIVGRGGEKFVKFVSPDGFKP